MHSTHGSTCPDESEGSFHCHWRTAVDIFIISRKSSVIAYKSPPHSKSKNKSKLSRKNGEAYKYVPPLAIMVWPVISLACSESRKAMTFATPSVWVMPGKMRCGSWPERRE